MLKFKDYSLIGKCIQPFIFTQLSPDISGYSSIQTYCDSRSNRYAKMTYDSIKEVQLIDRLSKKGLILNYKGALTYGKMFQVFISINEYTSLYEFYQNHLCNQQQMQQKFCIQLIQSILYIFLELEKSGEHLRIITPASIGLRNININSENYGFGLLLPLPSMSLQCLFKEQYESNIQFAAPEIIQYFEQNKQFTGCQKDYRKACLYSFGLVLLSCFGYNFTGKERIDTLKNGKQFKIIFKRIRKQIKLLHKGKYVPKVLKLLLEDCQKSRDLLQTFDIKIHSPQFQDLKTYKQSISMHQVKITTKNTQGDAFKTQNQHSKSQKTISLAIGSNSSQLTFSQKSYNIPSEKYQSPVNIQVSEDDETINEKNNKNISNSYMSFQEQQDMVTSFKKYKAKVIEEVQEKAENERYEVKEQQQQQQQEKNEKFIKYNAQQLRISPSQNQTVPKPQPQFGMEQQGPKFVIEDGEQLQVDWGPRKQLNNESIYFISLLIISIFLYGIAKSLRDE